MADPTPPDFSFIQTTPGMRARLRELSDVNGKDDYDRAVILLLDDFAKLVAYVAPLADAVRRAALRPSVPSLEKALRRYMSAIAALGQNKNGKTLFEGSPIDDQECFEAWRELNDAGVNAKAALQAQALEPSPDGLHAETSAMLDKFFTELRAKLLVSEQKYGYQDDWHTRDWEATCKAELLRHVHKGDPLDVAAYAAFCHARGWTTAPQPSADDVAVLDKVMEVLHHAGHLVDDAEDVEADQKEWVEVLPLNLHNLNRAVSALLDDGPLHDALDEVRAVLARMVHPDRRAAVEDEATDGREHQEHPR